MTLSGRTCAIFLSRAVCCLHAPYYGLQAMVSIDHPPRRPFREMRCRSLVCPTFKLVLFQVPITTLWDVFITHISMTEAKLRGGCLRRVATHLTVTVLCGGPFTRI